MDALISWWTKICDQFKLNFVDDQRWLLIVKGFGNTLLITFFACLIGIFLGFLVAIIRSSYDKTKDEMKPGIGKGIFSVINWIAKAYLTIIRGTPTVVQLLIAYFIIFASSNSQVFIAVIAFGINSGAYVAEIVRSGIMSVDNGQFEAGRSLGFNYVQTMWYIIIPQAFKAVLPALANEFIVLLKETSISGYIGLMDLTKAGDKIRGVTYSPFMPLFAVALVYLLVVSFFTKLVAKLERSLRNNER